MRITTLLMKPFLQQLEQEFASLAKQIGPHSSPQAGELYQNIENKKMQAQRLQSRFPGESTQSVIPAEIYDDFRQLKLDLRFMRRRWLKIISNTECVKKKRARRTYVSTVAA